MKLVYLAPAVLLAATTVIAAEDQCNQVAVEDLGKKALKKYQKLKTSKLKRKFLIKACAERQKNGESCCPASIEKPEEKPEVPENEAQKFMEETNQRLERLEKGSEMAFMGMEKMLGEMSDRLNRLEKFMSDVKDMMDEKEDGSDADKKDENDTKTVILMNIMSMMEKGMTAEQIAPEIKKMLDGVVAMKTGEYFYSMYEKEQDADLKSKMEFCLKEYEHEDCKPWYEPIGQDITKYMIEDMIMMAVEYATTQEGTDFHNDCLESHHVLMEKYKSDEGSADMDPATVLTNVEKTYADNYPYCYAEMKRIYNDQQIKIMNYAKRFYKAGIEKMENDGNQVAVEGMNYCLNEITNLEADPAFNTLYNGRVDWEMAYALWYDQNEDCAKGFEPAWYEGFIQWSAEMGMKMAVEYQEKMEDMKEAKEEGSMKEGDKMNDYADKQIEVVTSSPLLPK